MMYPNCFGDHLTFFAVREAGCNFNLSSKLSKQLHVGLQKHFALILGFDDVTFPLIIPDFDLCGFG